MTFQWHFRPKRLGDDISDPIGGEFFSDGSLGENPATALVREALQNALDAGKGVDRDGKPIRVRLGLFNGDRSLSAAESANWFDTLWPHVTAHGNGLKDAPNSGTPCPYLVIEDFGTTGLTGDLESDSADGERNNFVDFLRSDARTRKSEGDRGSWGVGKNVFPRSSRINGYIAFTVRRTDGRRLVMGKAIFKIRRVQGEQFQPASYLASSWLPDEVPRPYEDTGLIQRLRADFRVTRVDEPGLSLVLPWPDPEMTFEDLRKAVLEQFYFAILSGSLEVVLAQGNDEVLISSSSIVKTVATCLPQYSPNVDLAAWAIALPDSERAKLLQPPQPPRWGGDSLPEEVRDALNLQLVQNGRIAVRVPLQVPAESGAEQTLTYFDVFAEYHSGDQVLRPAFFREELAISGVKRAIGVPKIRALVVIEHSPLANLLRAAEPPNHTDWDPKTANFRNAYKDGSYVITFVKTAVKQLVSLLRSGDEEPDPTVTIDFFAIPKPDKTPSPPDAAKKTKDKGSDTDMDPDSIVPSPPRFRISRISGGFVIGPAKDPDVRPESLRIAVAYDILNGSPWKRYEPADFDFQSDKSGITIEIEKDAELEIVGPNSFEIEIGGPEFQTKVTGFDENRDLIVRAYNPRESENVDPETELHEADEVDA